MRESRPRVVTVVLAGVLAVCVLAACGNDASSNSEKSGNNTLTKAQKADVITVGFANEKPYAYLDENNELKGEAVGVAKAVLGNLGIAEMEEQLLEFGQLISGVQTGKFDIITAGMAVRPDRCGKVIFAEPEYRMGGGLAVKKGNPKDLHSYADIGKNEDARIAVMAGAIEIQQLKDNGVSANQIVEVPDQPTAINALQSGQVDGITMTYMALMEMIKSANDENIVRVEDFIQPPDAEGNESWSYGAAAFRMEDTALRDAYNAELQKLKESGELLTILESNGFAEEHLPGDMTTAQLCGQ